MKTILLMRHAKSDWGDPELPDFDRPLGKRGLEDAPRMGKAMSKIGRIPDAILSSPARRALQTAELFAEAAGWKGTIDLQPELYGAPGESWLRVLRSASPDAGCVLVVAHSPGCEEASALLLASQAAIAVRFPTGAILCAESKVDQWSRLRPGCATLHWFLVPRMVKAL
jgi:phosphohistidine phosphatase